MHLFVRKRTVASAFQFEGQPASEWPEFVQTFEVHTMMGIRNPTLSIVGQMVIPQRHGPDLLVNRGDWFVIEGTRMSIMHGGEFASAFEPSIEHEST